MKQTYKQQTPRISADDIMKIVKTRTPFQYDAKIVTQPSGEQIWWLVALEDRAVNDLNLSDSVVENTADFFTTRKIGRPWEPGVEVEAGDVLSRDDKWYRVIDGKGHTTQTNWAPPEASLFVETDPYNIDEWKAPTGAHDAPNRRDLRQKNGEIWRSVVDGNTTVPGSDSRYWVKEGQELPELEAEVRNWSDYESHEFQNLDAGTPVTDEGQVYKLINPSQGHRKPSGEFGHFGWKQVN